MPFDFYSQFAIVFQQILLYFCWYSANKTYSRCFATCFWQIWLSR